MARYFFNIKDGLDIIDDVGTECADLSEARTMALSTAGQMIKELGPKFWDEPNDWVMTVTNADGQSQFVLRFAAR
jgi:hypothetical protein